MPHDDWKFPLLDRWEEKPYFLWMRSRPSFFGGLKIRFKRTSIGENILLNRPKIGTQSPRKYFSMPFPGLWSHFRFSPRDIKQNHKSYCNNPVILYFQNEKINIFIFLCFSSQRLVLLSWSELVRSGPRFLFFWFWSGPIGFSPWIPADICFSWRKMLTFLDISQGLQHLKSQRKF